MSLRKSKKPAGKVSKRAKHEMKTIVNRTIVVNCDCNKREQFEWEDPEIEMEILKEVTCCNCNKMKKKKNHLHVKPQTQKRYKLLAVIPATLKVA